MSLTARPARRRRRLLKMRGSRRSGILAFPRDHCDRRIDRDIVGAIRHEDFRKGAVVDRLDLHGRLVGFDLGEDIARAHRVTFFF